MKSKLLLLIVCTALASMGTAQDGRAEGWSWQTLNPLAKEPAKKKPVTRRTTTRAQSEKPSIAARMAGSVKRTYNKTADALTFKKKKPAKSNSRYAHLGSNKKSKKSESESLFDSWFDKDNRSDSSKFRY